MDSSLTVNNTEDRMATVRSVARVSIARRLINMRRLLLGFALLVLCSAFSSTAAHAETTIDFNINAGGVTFTSGSGGSVTVTIDAGNGSATWGSSAGEYTLTGGPVTLTETS